MNLTRMKSTAIKTLFAVAVATAATSAMANGGDSLGITTALGKLQQILHNSAGIVLTIGIAVVGYSFVASEHGTPFKTALRLVGAGAVILGASNLVMNLFSAGALV